MEEHKEEQKFELTLRMSENGIVCNAQALKDMLPSKLKPYNYIVTAENYDTAKADRAKLNNLCKVLKNARDKFENTDLQDWKTFKATIMDMEKMITQMADNLDNGVKDIDDKAQVEKMDEVRESYNIVAQSMPLQIPFEKLYSRKTYDAKKWTVKKILEDLQIRIDKIVQEWKLMGAYLPDYPADLEQVKQVYIDTLDVAIAKSKADDLRAIRHKIASQQAETHEEPKQAPETPQIPNSEPNLMNVDKKQRVVAEFTATRPFYDEMNVLVKKHKVAVKVIEREDL